MKNIITLLSALAFCVSGVAQKNVKLTIKHLLGTSPFAYNEVSQNNRNDDFKIDRVDYYLSGISIIHDGGMVTSVGDTTLIVKGDYNYVADLGSFNVTDVEGITFSVGVDAAVNHNDPSVLPLGHPLSFQSPSMHWGWSSGYRFVAIEGKSGQNVNETFQFHGLFDQNYFEQTKMAAGEVDGNDIYIHLDADYAQAFYNVDLSTGQINHGDNQGDLTVLENFRDYVFTPGTGFPLSVNDIENSLNVKVYPIPSTGNVHVKIDQPDMQLTNTNITIVDIVGRKVKSISLENQNETSFDLDQKGVFIMHVVSDDLLVTSRKLIIN